MSESLPCCSPTSATLQHTDVSLADPPQTGSGVSGARPVIHGHWGTNTRCTLQLFWGYFFFNPFMLKNITFVKENSQVFLSASENVRGSACGTVLQRTSTSSPISRTVSHLFSLQMLFAVGSALVIWFRFKTLWCLFSPFLTKLCQVLFLFTTLLLEKVCKLSFFF